MTASSDIVITFYRERENKEMYCQLLMRGMERVAKRHAILSARLPRTVHCILLKRHILIVKDFSSARGYSIEEN